MKKLLLTLGHNSSAILIENNEIVWGYETERFTEKKSDSVFPEVILSSKNIVPDEIYVTHWDPFGHLSNMASKYWRPEHFHNIPVRTLSFDFTHHDSHIYAAMLFAGDRFYHEDTLGVVCDGFGNYGEHLSIYKFIAGQPKLIARYRGYTSSLGLFYQYATAFMQLKMHEDEYKLLGYEAHIDEVECDIVKLQVDIDTCINKYLDHLFENNIYLKKDDPVYNLNALPYAREKIYKIFLDVCHNHNITDSSEYRSRVILSYFTQAVLEGVITKIVFNYRFSNLLLSGGVFYNVKLNKLLIDKVPNQVCVYPLCGDQGNALGLYYHDNPRFQFKHNNLTCWGERKLNHIDGQIKNLHLYNNASAAYSKCIDLIDTYGYVNLVRDNMEFGPRALCNTSTLAKPVYENVTKINLANGRNTVMPMAPVVTEDFYDFNFKNTYKVHKSEHYMITALEYTSKNPISYSGAAHKYPDGIYTGRPQVVNKLDQHMNNLLNYYGGILINTSFNIHGVPIAFDMPSVIKHHIGQINVDDSFNTVVITNDK